MQQSTMREYAYALILWELNITMLGLTKCVMRVARKIELI